MHPHDDLFEAATGRLFSQETLDAARAARDADVEDRSLLEAALRQGVLSIRQANRVLETTSDRVLLCPDCKDYQVHEWRRFGEFLRCPKCGLDLSNLRQDLCLPEAENLTEGFEYGPSLVGRIDGNLHIRRRLPDGRYAGWYAGQKRPRGERVVLLEVSPEIMADDARFAAFERAFEIVGRLQHPARPLYFELARVARRLFVVQTPMEGPSVRDLVTEGGQMAPLDMLRIMTPIAGLIQAAHKAGLQGFALFPELVVMEGQTEPRVLDVGTGFLRRRVPGQLAYLPPEALDGSPLDAAGDIYSYCAICRYMLAGEPPFGGATCEEVESAVRSPTLAPLGELRDDLQPELATLLDAGLSKLPADRPADMEQVLRQMESARQHQRWLAECARDAMAERTTASTQPEPSRPDSHEQAPAGEQPQGEPGATPESEPAPAPTGPRISDEHARAIAELRNRTREHIEHRRFTMAARALRRIIEFESHGEAYAAEASNARKLLARIDNRTGE